MDVGGPAPADGDGGGLVEPLPASLARLLRRAVLDHALAERRRRHPTIVHVGVPGDTEHVFAVRPEDPTDHALRTDLLAAMLARHRRGGGGSPLVWLTRHGGLDPQDVDLAWLAAARAAYLEAGLPLVLVVVDRHGWRDPRSGLSRHWVRLRRR